MSDTEIGPGGAPIAPGTLNAPSAGGDPIFPGTPVIAETLGGDSAPFTGLDTALATAYTTSACIGIALTPANAEGVIVNYRYAGPQTLTAAQWAAVLDTGASLTTGAKYYVSAATRGKLTLTPPVATGSFASHVGIALSPLTLLVLPQPGTFAHA